MTVSNKIINDTRYHVCICGGGVTGLSMGLKLAKKYPEKQIAVIESGGVSPGMAQAANIGKIIGNEVYTLEASRMRGLSGTQWMWGGNSRPFDRIDFEKRDWIPNSGWPISFDEYYKYIKPATSALDIDDSNWSKEHPGLKHFQINDDEIFEHNHFKLSPQISSNSKKATGTYYQSNQTEIDSQSNLKVITDHTLVDLEFNPESRRVESVSFLSIDKNPVKIYAQSIVFAMVCLENSRMLKYLSEKSDGKNLPVNKNIGRYFMEHPHGSISRNIISAIQIPAYKNSYGVRIGTAVHQARYRARDEVQREKHLLNTNISTKRSGSASLADLPNIPSNQVNYSVILSEQEPLFENGIVLRKEKDMFGVPMIDLEWAISDKVYDSINFISKTFTQFLLVNNFSRSSRKVYVKGQKIGGGHHHMGTTRMGSTAKDAVVDANCQVFGVSNLYVAGGSVFPTSGAVNPTINMVALGFRLADYLGEKYLS